MALGVNYITDFDLSLISEGWILFHQEIIQIFVFNIFKTILFEGRDFWKLQFSILQLVIIKKKKTFEISFEMMYSHLSNLYKNLSIFKNLARKKIERYIFFPVLTFKNSTFKLLKLTSWKWSKLFWCNHRFISNSNLVKTIIESQSTTEHLLQIWSQPYSTTCVHSNRLHLRTHLRVHSCTI